MRNKVRNTLIAYGMITSSLVFLLECIADHYILHESIKISENAIYGFLPALAIFWSYILIRPHLTK